MCDALLCSVLYGVASASCRLCSLYSCPHSLGSACSIFHFVVILILSLIPCFFPKRPGHAIFRITLLSGLHPCRRQRFLAGHSRMPCWHCAPSLFSNLSCRLPAHSLSCPLLPSPPSHPQPMPTCQTAHCAGQPASFLRLCFGFSAFVH